MLMQPQDGINTSPVPQAESPCGATKIELFGGLKSRTCGLAYVVLHLAASATHALGGEQAAVSKRGSNKACIAHARAAFHIEPL